MINLNSGKHTPAARAALQNMLTAIHEAKIKQPSLTVEAVFNHSRIPTTRREAKAMLLTPAQANALQEMQKLAMQITKLRNHINVLTVSFGFALDPLIFPELGQRLSDIDSYIFESKWVARRLGVNAVMSDFRIAQPVALYKDYANA